MTIVLYSPREDALILVRRASNATYDIQADMDVAYNIQKFSLNGESFICFDDFVYLSIEDF